MRSTSSAGVISTFATSKRAASFCRSRSMPTCTRAAVFPEPGAPPNRISRPGRTSRALNGSGSVNRTGGSPRYALWGELMSTRALKLGAAGAVLNGYARDADGILRLNFPAFAYGRYAQDQGPRGKVIDFRVSVEIEGVRVRPGDYVFGDSEGVLIVPEDAAEESFSRALEKARGEKLVKKALEDGLSASDAFQKFGIM